ncbi:hypothetical protein ANN_16188 [Periplaneta americana]|uniref:Mos1 transposase HTH domain-containing protein n=1 Tax=Periplaneta americana TaxID=6978 RepID=A0ABQ8SK90_PERAM|nr:hypothetical protein ANN_16188 [Periplaneta americana]
MLKNCTIARLDPKFVALHCQEVGGKNYERSMKHVEYFVRLLMSSEELRLFDKVQVYLDEDFSSAENFTALGNFYFIHESVSDVLMWDFAAMTFVPAKGKEVHSGNIEAVTTKEKSKFPQDFFPEQEYRVVASWSKASRLGLALRNARWFESSWGKKFSHEISASVWDRCPPSIVMHLGSYDRSTGFLNMCSHNVVSTGCNKSPLCILCYFKMNDVIDNPSDCEVRSVIRFLNARHLKPAEIYRQLKEVYGDTVMNERNVRKWCEMFNNGQTNVHDETRPGRPSLITEDLKTKVNDRILQDRGTSLDELHIAFPDISRSLLGEIVSQHLGYHKICAQWVPRQLSDRHKTQRMASALTFLMRYHTDGDAFVTGDETWVSHNTPET